MVESTPSLSRISFVGNSLGGLYVRYAAKLLYREDGGGGSTTSGDGEATHGSQTDARTVKAREHEAPGDASTSSSAGQQDAEPAAARTGGGTVAGLKPSVFMTIASPHLGVRRFTYVPLPPPLHPLAGVFVGKTGSDLFLSSKASSTRGCRQYPRSSSPRAADATSTASPVVPPGDANVANGGGGGGGREDPLLYQMATTQEFLRPLKAFRWRRVYANRRGDFMVPYETAAFVEHNEGDGSDAPLREDVVERGTGTHTRVRTGTSGFSFADHVLGAKQGAIVGMSRVPPAAAGGPDGVPSRSAAAAVSTVNKRSMSAGRTGVLARAKAPGARGGKKSMEAEMAAGLNSCGWEKVWKVNAALQRPSRQILFFAVATLVQYLLPSEILSQLLLCPTVTSIPGMHKRNRLAAHPLYSPLTSPAVFVFVMYGMFRSLNNIPCNPVLRTTNVAAAKITLCC